MTAARHVLAPLCAVMAWAGAAQAERVECAFDLPGGAGTPLDVSFDIDRGQFAPPVDPKEPPRNKVTRVAMGGESFVAEAILMDSGVRGFWARIDGRDHLLTVQPDGTGIYSKTPPGDVLTGYCGVFD